MGLLDIFKGRPKVEELMQRAGSFGVVRWSPAAHDLGVNQKMIYLYNRGFLVDTYPLTRARAEELEDDYDVVIVDETAGSMYPPEYEKPSPSEAILSRLRLNQWIN